MKKTYIAPEVEVVSLAVENTTNVLDLETGKDDTELSLGVDLGDLFN